MIEIKKKTKLLYVCLMAIALQSCQERMETEETPLQSQESQSGQIKLGDKWELPYSLRNVRAAYDSLMAENPLRSGGLNNCRLRTITFVSCQKTVLKWLSC